MNTDQRAAAADAGADRQDGLGMEAEHAPSCNGQLERDAFGRLLLRRAGQMACEVQAVRAFPVEAPDDGIALVDALGKEQAWISSLAQLSAAEQVLVRQALASRDFMPVIEAIESISSQATPSVWRIATDRGPTTLTLRSEQDIRRLAGGRLLITDAEGLTFVLPDMTRLDRASRKALDHFL